MGSKPTDKPKSYTVEVVRISTGQAACAHAAYEIEDGEMAVPESCLGCFADTTRFHVGDVVKG